MGRESLSVFAATTVANKYAFELPGGRKESWEDIAERQAREVVGPYLPDLVDPVRRAIAARKLMPGGRYLYAAGRPFPQVNNCFLFRAEDSRDDPGGWADTMGTITSALMTGGGVGVSYGRLRPEGFRVRGMGGKSTGPLALANMVNEAGRYIMQGGSRRSAIWAGLPWWHPDVLKFIRMKRPTELMKRVKEEDFTFPAPMEGTNISVLLDSDFFAAIRYGKSGVKKTSWGDVPFDKALAETVYWAAVREMLETGEPGFSIDVGANEGEELRNACTEVTSRDDGDCCNLASLNFARISSPDEVEELTYLGTAFLLCGTIYAKLPVKKMEAVREKNRRVGLGIMGVADFLLSRGLPYAPAPILKAYLERYERSTEFGREVARRLGINTPVATRSIAPTGTISIAAETTSGIEPLFAAAYKRRYLKGKEWYYQYVVDLTAKRLVEEGADPDLIEDAYSLAEDVERRIDFQVFVQKYVDHGISSTINLPEWGSSLNNESRVEPFGKALLERLPSLRGITAYPNGARGGQPLTRVPYSEAVKFLGTEFVEERETSGDNCKGGFCGS